MYAYQEFMIAIFRNFKNLNNCFDKMYIKSLNKSFCYIFGCKSRMNNVLHNWQQWSYLRKQLSSSLKSIKYFWIYGMVDILLFLEDMTHDLIIMRTVISASIKLSPMCTTKTIRLSTTKAIRLSLYHYVVEKNLMKIAISANNLNLSSNLHFFSLQLRQLCVRFRRSYIF